MARKQPDANGDHATAPARPESAIEPPDHEVEERGNYPSHVVRFGLVRACVWQVLTDQGTRHNVTVSRLYKGGDDAWHSSNTFSYRDLLPLAKALDWAHTHIAEQIALSDTPF